MRNFPFLLILFVVLNQPLAIFAQSVTPSKTALGRLVPASPEASSIALYQSYPVDYVSGAPSIEIPLFDVPTRAGTIPLKLNYHIGRLKPSELTGGPGWGWTLLPNFGITRSIRGGMDGVNAGYPANSQFGGTTEAYYLGASLYNLDEQPDDFYYSLLGKSGQFIYNRNGGFTTVTYDPVKISHPDNNTFIITDDDGTIYRFGKYSTGSEVRTEFAGGGTPPINLTAWKITEIIPYDKSDTIRFIYGNSKNTYITPYYNIQWQIKEFLEYWDPLGGNMKPVNITRPGYGGSAGIGTRVMRPTFVSSGYFTPFEPALDYNAPNMYDHYIAFLTDVTPGTIREQNAWSGLDYGTPQFTGNEVSENATEQLPLTEIRFKGGKVTFSYVSGNQLSTIALYSNNTLVRKAELFQHPLTHPNAEQPVPYDSWNPRFGLNKVKITGSDTAKAMVYRVEYDHPSLSCGVYANYNTDYWGFVNNKLEGNVPHILYHVDRFVFAACLLNTNTADDCSTTSRMNTGAWADIGYKQEQNMSFNPIPGMIKKLIFPTGGFAEFTFEVNLYPSPTNVGMIAFGGGYRIKQIDYKTGDGRDVISKRYKYGYNEDGVGRVKYKNFYENFVSVQYVNSDYYGSQNNLLQKIATINAKPHLDMSFASGAAVLYPEVTEYTVNPANNTPLGKTVYEYIIDSKNDAFIPETPIQRDTRDDWKIISFKSQKNYRYNSSPGTFSLVNRTDYSYGNFVKELVPVAQTFLRYYNVNESQGVLFGNPPAVSSKFAHTSYDVITGARKLTEVRDTVFNPDNLSETLITVRTIEYDTVHLYKKSETLVDSKGQARKTQYLYPYQANQMTSLPVAQQSLLAGLQTANRVAQPVETREYNNSSLLTTTQQNFTQYPNARIFPSAVYNSILGNSLEKRMEIGLYDTYGNILEQRKADDVMEVYVWGYNRRYPVAKIIGSDFNTVQSFIDQVYLDSAHTYTDANVRTALQAIRTGLGSTNAQVFTYTYKPLVGITSETDAAGRITYYEYDSLGRLHIVKDHEGRIIKTICYNYNGQPEDCGSAVN